MELEPVRKPESSSISGGEGAKEAEARTTWVWDRNKQAWVETMEKPPVEERSKANDSATREPVVPRQPSATPASVIRKVRWSRSAWKLLATKASVIRAIDALAPKSKAPEPFGAEAVVRERTKNKASGTISKARQEAKGLPIMIIGTTEEQARNALSKVGDEARETKEKAARQTLTANQEAQRSSPDGFPGVEQQGRGIIKAVEEKAEARTENIIARVEEKARTQAEEIIARVEEKAEAMVENIVARVEEKARKQAEEIIARVEEKAEARVENIIARAEEKARVQAEEIIARVEEKANERAETIVAEARAAWKETVSAAEHQAQHILKTAGEKAEEIQAPAGTIVKAVPEQLAPRLKESDQKGRPASYEGTAELVLGPPVDLGKMQKVLARLAKFDQIRVLDLEGSKGKGISIKLFSRNVARLPSILAALPEVEKVSDLPRKLAKICHGQRICPGLWKGNELPAIRLLVTMEKRTTYMRI